MHSAELLCEVAEVCPFSEAQLQSMLEETGAVSAANTLLMYLEKNSPETVDCRGQVSAAEAMNQAMLKLLALNQPCGGHPAPDWTPQSAALALSQISSNTALHYLPHACSEVVRVMYICRKFGKTSLLEEAPYKQLFDRFFETPSIDPHVALAS